MHLHSNCARNQLHLYCNHSMSDVWYYSWSLQTDSRWVVSRARLNSILSIPIHCNSNSLQFQLFIAIPIIQFLSIHFSQFQFNFFQLDFIQFNFFNSIFFNSNSVSVNSFFFNSSSIYNHSIPIPAPIYITKVNHKIIRLMCIQGVIQCVMY